MVKEKKASRQSKASKTSRQSVKPQLPANIIIANNPVEPVVPLVETFAYNVSNKPPNLILKPKGPHTTSNKHVSFNRNAVSQYGLHPISGKSDGYMLLQKVGTDKNAIFPDEGFWYGPEHKNEQRFEISVDPTNPNNRSFKGRHYLSRRPSIKEANTLFKTNNPENPWWWFGRVLQKKGAKVKVKEDYLKCRNNAFIVSNDERAISVLFLTPTVRKNAI